MCFEACISEFYGAYLLHENLFCQMGAIKSNFLGNLLPSVGGLNIGRIFHFLSKSGYLLGI